MVGGDLNVQLQPNVDGMTGPLCMAAGEPRKLVRDQQEAVLDFMAEHEFKASNTFMRPGEGCGPATPELMQEKAFTWAAGKREALRNHRQSHYLLFPQSSAAEPWVERRQHVTSDHWLVAG